MSKQKTQDSTTQATRPAAVPPPEKSTVGDARMMATHKVVLRKFGSLGCGPCIAMAKAKTLEKFIEKHPEIKLEILDVSDANWETPPGTRFEEADKIANTRDISSLPTIVFDAARPPAGNDGELLRIEGGISLKELEYEYAELLKELSNERPEVDDTEEDGADDEEGDEDDARDDVEDEEDTKS